MIDQTMGGTATAGACPDAETLALLLETGEDAAQRSGIETHVEKCERCQNVLAELADNAELRRLRPAADAPSPEANGAAVLPELFAALQQLLSTCSQLGEQTVKPPSTGLGFLDPPEHDGDLGRLAHYRILAELQRGGMGRVFKALDPGLGCVVAIKVLPPEWADRASLDRFRQEAAATARVRHDHVVAIHAVQDSAKGVPYIVMEYIDGPTLAGRIDPDRPMEPREAAEVCRQVALGLAAAHKVQLVHRDIKPANILLDRTTGRAKIVDFGLVRVLDRDSDSDKPLTQPNAVPGTPAYLSPEQLGPSAWIDGRSDVYSLGVTLYETLTGRRPFRGSVQEIIHQVAHDEPVPVRRLNARVPRDLETICLTAMAKEPARRYQSATELADDLARFLRGEPIRARRVGTVERFLLFCRRSPLRAGAAVLAVLVVLLTATAAAALNFAWAAAQDRLDAQQREAEERANRERERIAALEREGEERARRERGLLRADHLLKQQMELLGQHVIGWSQRAWDLGLKAAAIDKDDHVRDQLVASLVGLDARAIGPWKILDASDLAVSRDGKRVLLGATPGFRGLPPAEARIWDLATQRVVHESKRTGAGPVVFDGDDNPLQLARADDHLVLWDVAGQKQIGAYRFDALPGKDALEITTYALARDRSRVAASATTTAHGKVTATYLALWDARSGKRVFQRTLADKATVEVLEFGATGQHLAAGDDEGRVTLWALDADGPTARMLPEKTTPIECLAFSRAGDRLAVGAKGGRVTIWDLAARPPKAISFCHGLHYNVSALCLSPDNMLLASSDRGKVRLWDAATGRSLLTLPVRDVNALAFTPDGRTLVAADMDPYQPHGRLHVWALEAERGIQALYGLQGEVSRVCLSPDGRRIAALAHDWQVGVWNRTGRLLHRFDVPAGLFADNGALAFNDDGSRLAFCAGSSARLWNLDTGHEEGAWELPPGLGDCLAFEPTSHQLQLFRFETADNVPPIDDNRWHKHERVCRLRTLRAGASPRQVLPDIRDFKNGLYAAIASADGTTFIAEGFTGADGRDRWIKAYDAAKGTTLWDRDLTNGRAPAPRTSRLHHDPVGQFVVFHATDDSASLVETRTGKEIHRWAEARDLGPDLRYTTGAVSKHPVIRHNAAAIFQRDGKHPVIVLGLGAPVSSMAAQFDRSGRFLAFGTSDGTVQLCDLESVRGKLNENQLGMGW